MVAGARHLQCGLEGLLTFERPPVRAESHAHAAVSLCSSRSTR
jgi:hypothetical protein